MSVGLPTALGFSGTVESRCGGGGDLKAGARKLNVFSALGLALIADGLVWGAAEVYFFIRFTRSSARDDAGQPGVSGGITEMDLSDVTAFRDRRFPPLPPSQPSTQPVHGGTRDAVDVRPTTNRPPP